MMNHNLLKVLNVFNILIGAMGVFNFFFYPHVITGVIAALGILVIIFGIKNLQSERIPAMGESAFFTSVFIAFGAANLFAAFTIPFMQVSMLWIFVTGFNIWNFIKLPKFEKENLKPYVQEQIFRISRKR